MAFTEFCCRSGGSNLNAGTRTGNSTEPGTSANFTYASGTWVSATGVFTPASGNPSTDGVAVGDFASVYADGASVTTLVGRVTAVSSTTITVSTTAKTGTTTDGTSNRTLRIGGAWQGPNGSSGFPMNFVTNVLANSSGDLPRINYKSDQTMSITANISTVNADTTHQGYTTSYSDLGKAILRGPTTGAAFNLIGTTVGANASLIDFDCGQNGATGSSGGVFWNGTGQVVRCVFHDFRGSGLQSNNTTFVKQCEAYSCNQSNTASIGGFNLAGSGASIQECISHDNTGSNNNGYYLNAAGITAIQCIADTNGNDGFVIDTAGNSAKITNCDAYNNGRDGIRLNLSANGNTWIENTNLIDNAGWGINFAGAGKVQGHLETNGFGSGTAANGSGTVGGSFYGIVQGTVTYAADVTPYNAPSTGDFRIALAAAKGTGHGTYTQTAASYAGTVGYPDIGAAQHAASGGGVRQINIRGGADQ